MADPRSIPGPAPRPTIPTPRTQPPPVLAPPHEVALEAEAFLVASAGLYDTAQRDTTTAALVTFLASRDRLQSTPGAALTRAIATGQAAFHVRIRVEILGEVEAVIVPRRR